MSTTVQQLSKPARAYLEVLLAEKIVEQAEVVATHLELFLETGEPDAVFRQRTGLNRFLTYLSIARSAGLENKIAKTAIPLRAWRKRFGRVRDLDVMEEWLEYIGRQSYATKKAAPGLAWMREKIVRRRRKRFERLMGRIEGEGGAEEIRELVGTWRAWAERNDTAENRALAAKKNPERLLEAVESIVLPPLERQWVALRDPAIERPDDETLHTFRIANKRLRDAAEVLVAASPDWGKTLKLLRAIHKTLGNMHDLAVLLDEVNHRRMRRAVKSRGATKMQEELAMLRRAIDEAREQEFTKLLRLWPSLHEPSFGEELPDDIEE